MVYIGATRLKDFIRQIRSCKTLADERAVIAKESAAIRTFFKENSSNADLRHTHVAKLLYIHMLGFPAHFGQVESVKLVASPRFTDKRLGYLAVMLLLDENQEVLTLVTNSLQNDLNNPNMYIVGLALSALGNIASHTLLLDLHDEVIRLLDSPNSYIRKKAALCAVQVVTKCPHVAGSFVGPSRRFLSEKHHGALLTGVCLITELCRLGQEGADQEGREYLEDCRKNMVPTLLKHLKGLVTAGYSPDHDVGGITDPFLHAAILRLLRVLGSKHAAASELMNDVLAQVATSTESSKNVGNAILYETVLTILDIQADPSLNVLAINILGKFLANRDNNVRYVALQTLNKTVLVDKSANAIQRHRITILDCLRDPDISIRRRALELSFALITSQNIRLMTRELLNYLETSAIQESTDVDPSFEPGIVTNICASAEKFAPNRRWHIDTIIRVMRIAGNSVREDVVASFVKLVTNTPELHGYTVLRLFQAANHDEGLSQEGLVHATLWMVGEYGDILVSGDRDNSEIFGDLGGAPSASEVIDWIEKALGYYVEDTSNTPTTTVKEYALTSLAKLAARFGHESHLTTRIRKLIQWHENALDVEVQQRAAEYIRVLDLDPGTSGKVMDRIPALEVKKDDRPVFGAQGDEDSDGPGPCGGDSKENKSSAKGTFIESASLLDLDGTSTENQARRRSGNGKSGNAANLLQDIFGRGSGAVGSGSRGSYGSAARGAAGVDVGDLLGGSVASRPVAHGGSPKTGKAVGPAPSVDSTLLGFLSGPSSQVPSTESTSDAPNQPMTPSAVPEAEGVLAYDCYGLSIRFQYSKAENRTQYVVLKAHFRNSNPETDISDLVFQVAVPKSQKIQMKPLSSTDIPPLSSATQQMRIHNPQQGPLKLRMRVTFRVGGEEVQETKDFAGFPSHVR